MKLSDSCVPQEKERARLKNWHSRRLELETLGSLAPGLGLQLGSC